jgi:hypothetical protein
MTPVSTLGSRFFGLTPFGWAEEPDGRPMLGRVVGNTVLPALPDHPDPSPGSGPAVCFPERLVTGAASIWSALMRPDLTASQRASASDPSAMP